MKKKLDLNQNNQILLKLKFFFKLYIFIQNEKFKN